MRCDMRARARCAAVAHEPRRQSCAWRRAQNLHPASAPMDRGAEAEAAANAYGASAQARMLRAGRRRYAVRAAAEGYIYVCRPSALVHSSMPARQGAAAMVVIVLRRRCLSAR